MALSEKARSEIFQHLSPIVGDQATSEMLSYFPARDVEEPVTKEFLRSEMAGMRLELHTEIGAVRSELGDLRSEMHVEIGGLRSEMHVEIGGLRSEMHAAINRSMVWMIGTMIALAGVVSGVVLAAR